MRRQRKYPVLTLVELDELFERKELKSRNDNYKTIARNILHFGQTQRETAANVGVSHIYVNDVMQKVMQSHNQWKREKLPPGVSYLGDILVLDSDRKTIEQLNKKARDFIKAAMNSASQTSERV